MKKLSVFKTPGTAFCTKKIMALLLILCLSILSAPAFAGQISSIDELESTYSAEVCKECHRETHKGWENSWHGRSILDPRVLRTWRTFILSGLDRSEEGSRKDLRDICLPCHAPQTKDASDDLVREIAAMIIAAVEEIDTYETEDEPAPSGTSKTIPPAMFGDDITITDIMDTDKFELEPALTLPEAAITDSPWIRDEVNGNKDIMFGVLELPEPDFMENMGFDEIRKPAYDTAAKPVESAVLSESKVPVEGEIMIDDEDIVLEPLEDLTVSFVEDGDTPIEPSDNIPVEVKDLTATLVVKEGKVKIEYAPYDPADNQKEPVFLDKGETIGEKSLKKLSKLNINCMICHSMKALPGGNPRPRTIYSTGKSGNVEHKKALGAETRISGFMKTSEFCAQCHHGCPPGMPSSICPTIWTSYKEKYMARGGDKTCQECHMQGADKKNHSFPGIYETELVKKGISLTLDAEPTRYIYHLENRIVPAVLINVKVKNTAGHGIPSGCTYIPQTALQVSVTDQNGKELFFKEKIYTVYNLHLPNNSEGYLGLSDWDLTAMNRIDLGIDPGDTDSNTYVLPLNEETTSIIIEAVFKYLYEEGVSTVIHKEIKKIEFEIDKKSPRM